LTVSVTYIIKQQQCNISTCRPCDISTCLACDIHTVRQPCTLHIYMLPKTTTTVSESQTWFARELRKHDRQIHLGVGNDSYDWQDKFSNAGHV